MNHDDLNIPDTEKQRIVILGAGFAGLNLAKDLRNTMYQVVLIDRNNFHQFQPLFYQVAMAGLEPSAIAFPIRKMFHTVKNVFVRQAEIIEVDQSENRVVTDNGEVKYDILVICLGAETNFYGNEILEKHSFSLKSLGQSLGIRNQIFSDFEQSMFEFDYHDRQSFIDFVIVGGGPTGVEMAGALAEMKRYVIPKDYPELNTDEIDVYLVQSGDQLLPGMSDKSSRKAEKYLREMGVVVILNDRVEGYDGEYAALKSGRKIRTNKLVWAAGIKCPVIPGLEEFYGEKSGRISVDHTCKVFNTKNIYALGDIAGMTTEEYPRCHPQVAQVGIQMGDYLSELLTSQHDGSKTKAPFKYKNKGVMATIGRNKAVADFPSFSMAGFLSWVIWLWVHLFSLIGVRNKLLVVFNWMWNYFNYDSSLRLIIKQDSRQSDSEQEDNTLEKK